MQHILKRKYIENIKFLKIKGNKFRIHCGVLWWLRVRNRKWFKTNKYFNHIRIFQMIASVTFNFSLAFLLFSTRVDLLCTAYDVLMINLKCLSLHIAARYDVSIILLSDPIKVTKNLNTGISVIARFTRYHLWNNATEIIQNK